MNARETLNAAIDRLLDVHDDDPRSPLILALRRLAETPEELPNSATIQLTATLQPGGNCKVADQFGRTVEKVQSVAVFKDQRGRDVMQINLGE